MTGTTVHHRINDLLTVFVLGLCLYVGAFPLLPELQYQALGVSAQTVTSLSTVTPETPTLIIPKIGLSAEVFTDEGVETLEKGVWHRPHTSNSTSNGNIVMVAHRFQFTQGAQTFYHLDKVSMGDSIRLFWDGKVKEYVVTEIKEVNPYASEVEAPTDEPQLTLYTCTPLWTGSKRLVVIAKPI